MGRESTKLLLDLYKWKSSRSSEPNSNLNYKNRVMAPQSFPRWACLWTWNPLNEGATGSPRARTPVHYQECIPLTFTPTFPKGTYGHLPGWLHWGKGNNRPFRNSWTVALRWHLIPGDTKCNCGPPVRVGAYRVQIINKGSAQNHFTVGPVGPQTILWLFPQFQNAELE